MLERAIADRIAELRAEGKEAPPAAHKAATVHIAA